MTSDHPSAGAGVIEPPGLKRRDDWIAVAEDAIPFERIEAFFAGRAYEPHRHDTYAIGQTLSGVQSFRYRGAERTSLPGATMVLHPDELHDGQAGSEHGFRYRMIYIEPAAIQSVLGGRPLPFIKGGVTSDPRLFAAVHALLPATDARIETLEFEDGLFELAHALEGAAGGPSRATAAIDYRAAERARLYLHDLPHGTVTLESLEAISGRDRWSLSRDFRRLFGTSPYRYLVQRRLEAAKVGLRRGVPPAQAALESGFADQAHMSRHFKKAFGVTPGRWLRMAAMPLGREQA
ncbi:AraC family transcriptional regulator [Sinorhizobium fredii USDA 205]|uniref:AraC family transcriptional regulator n=1 Tax=Rhizobium fredii TaxID=380 RepID=A0A2A6LUP9_RHIFR|nr:AraC family transcriptional regulator [Sinorhizobium fredii]AWM23867.1 L-rhamnose operon transcriptional activator RhaR [Sinorhizobium fredii CCBAU 25509]KSV88146.1 AraC family transcriptional regulator [Sinorhizobium fredii USDA 205]MCG5474888.1 AraC family transcriptional regulator [Sinorhizobium fredii]MQW96540.1 helix-turn-helix domain-containing protein [Sinorhizobium fredii]MQX09997.1 helix-turn-helix domain-containing protein [Sinorhizobium fredii]